MKFEQLFTNFLDREHEDRLAFMTAYIQRRTEDIAAAQTSLIKPRKTTKKTKDKTVSVSAAQFALLQKLGLV